MISFYLAEFCEAKLGSVRGALLRSIDYNILSALRKDRITLFTSERSVTPHSQEMFRQPHGREKARPPSLSEARFQPKDKLRHPVYPVSLKNAFSMVVSFSFPQPVSIKTATINRVNHAFFTACRLTLPAPDVAESAITPESIRRSRFRFCGRQRSPRPFRRFQT